MTNKFLFIAALIPLLMVPLVNAQLTEQQQADKESAAANQNLTKMCQLERDAIMNMSTSDPLFKMNMDTYKTASCEDRTGVINK
jgi:hypothetical protein